MRTIPLFDIPAHDIHTADFSHSLHGQVVTNLEQEIADYVGAKYAVATCSASMAILIYLKHFVPRLDRITIPSNLPAVVANSVINAGHMLRFENSFDWIGGQYELAPGLIDSAHAISEGCFLSSCDAMIFSFYPTKPLSGLDGGMLVTNNHALATRFRMLCYNGYADKSSRTAIEHGWKAYMISFQAEIISMNLEDYGTRRRRLEDLRQQYNSVFGLSNYSDHLYRIHVDDNRHFQSAMRAWRIDTGIHYPALHLNPIYNSDHEGALHTSEEHGRTTASIPFHENMSIADKDRVIKRVSEYKGLAYKEPTPW